MHRSPLRILAAALLLAVALPSCRLIDLRVDPERTGVGSRALIEGYGTIGFADDPSFLRVDVLDGPSRGSVFYFELWYLLRVEVGLVGVSVGVLPFDVGIGTLFYHPRSPAAHHLVDRPWELWQHSEHHHDDPSFCDHAHGQLAHRGPGSPGCCPHATGQGQGAAACPLEGSGDHPGDGLDEGPGDGSEDTSGDDGDDDSGSQDEGPADEAGTGADPG